MFVYAQSQQILKTGTLYFNIPIYFFSPVRHVIEDLHMLFEADYLLPRSIIAVVTLRHLETALAPGLIPPYIAAACLFCHCHKFRTQYMSLEYRDVIIIYLCFVPFAM